MEKLTLAMQIENVLVLVIQHNERQAKKNTDKDQSQKVEQTTNVRYYPQYTNNLEAEQKILCAVSIFHNKISWV